MNTRRSSVGVGVVDGKTLAPRARGPIARRRYKPGLSSPGKLYAVGGYDGASRQCLSTVEEYDPVANQWCHVAEMSTRRSGAGDAS